MKYPPPRQESRILHCVHAAQVILALASFVIAIARLAFYGGPRSRTDVWIIAVVSISRLRDSAEYDLAIWVLKLT